MRRSHACRVFCQPSISPSVSRHSSPMKLLHKAPEKKIDNQRRRASRRLFCSRVKGLWTFYALFRRWINPPDERLASDCIENCNRTWDRAKFVRAESQQCKCKYSPRRCSRDSAYRDLTRHFSWSCGKLRITCVRRRSPTEEAHTQNVRHRRGPAANWQPSWLSAWANNSGGNYSRREVMRAHRALLEGVFPATWPRKRSSLLGVARETIRSKIREYPFHPYLLPPTTHTCIHALRPIRVRRWSESGEARTVSE